MNTDALAARLRALFVSELEEQVRTLNADLLSLEADPRSAERLGSVFRIVHTLKGAAHAAGVPLAENVCHDLEELLARAREGRVVLQPEDFSRLFAAADALTDAGQRLKEGRDLEHSPLRALQSTRREPPRAAAGSAPGVPAVAGPEAARRQLEIDPGGEPRPEYPPASSAPSSETAREHVRVEAEKLDALLASAGELLVASGRIAARPTELDELHALTAHWRRGWRRTAHRLRVLAVQANAAAPVLEALEEVERNLRQLAQESGRLAAAGRSDSRMLSQIVREVGTGVRRLRLRPFSDASAALPRAVRDLAAESGKEVRFEMVGGEVEADRAVLDMLHEVLLHLVRNAVDHGIEPPDERERAGKPRTGTVTVAAALERQRLRVTVADDGRGLDLAALRRHLEQAGRELPQGERDLVAVLFEPGFSTREEPTKISGRGVGLDAVRATVERIRGSVQVASAPGSGTTFTLECPPSLATMRAVLVSVGSQILAIPSTAVEHMLRVRPGEIRRAEGREVILTAGSPVPLVSLAGLLGLPLPDPTRMDHLTVVRVRSGDRRLAVIVDQVLIEEEIVVRPVERLRKPPAYLGGAALLGTGEVALVLNTASVVSAGWERASPDLRLDGGRAVSATRRRILVVDDSITTRALEQSILEAEGFEVIAATDGMEGWRILGEQPVDLVVSDVEMPRMNGFELCRAIRGSDRLSDLPIILVTGQEAAEHREQGLEAGADAYLPKSSFDQQSLLDTIQQLLG